MIFMALISLLSCKDMKPEQRFENIRIQEGDIVFRRGSSLASRLVLTADHSGIYSHIGIIVRKNDAYMVIHAVPGENKPGQPEKVKAESLTSFFSPEKTKAGALMRMNLSRDTLRMIAVKALEIFERNTLFDHSYDLSDSVRMYCSELVWFSYESAGIDISRNKRSKIDLPPFKGNYIFPSDIQTNKDLNIIFSF